MPLKWLGGSEEAWGHEFYCPKFCRKP